MTRLHAQLARDEGRRRSVYRDSEGYWTIGVGHLVDERLGGGLPEHIIDALLDHDIANARRDLRTALPWTALLDDERQAALVNMTFNLGIRRLLSFRRMIDALWNRDYARAAAEALDSKWARQVGDRAVRVAEQLKTGEWT